jgi:hypothetical protein
MYALLLQTQIKFYHAITFAEGKGPHRAVEPMMMMMMMMMMQLL